MATLLTEEDFHPFLAQDLSEYMETKKPPKATQKEQTKQA